MQQNKIANNIFYSILMQLAGFITPLILSPYISRVFNAELIGDYSYTLANSSYFVLAEGLGLTLYGMIKIAKVRDDKSKRSQLFWEIFWLKLILMIFCASIYCVIFFSVGTQRLKTLYLIMLLNLIANGIDTTWFFNGLEEFKIVAIRTIGVRITNIPLVLLLVKTEHDLNVYAIIMQGVILVSYLTVLPACFKRVSWIQPHRLKLFQHLRLSLIYFVPGLVNTIFASADKSVLGAFSQNAYEVGVYEQANKVCQLCTGLINAISNVILPRTTYLYANTKDSDKAYHFTLKTIRVAIMASFPLSLGIVAISDQFIPAFFGAGYEKSILLLKILCFNVLSVVISNFIAQQCLIARDRQKEYNISVGISALLNIILNVFLVNRFLSIGVSVASVISGLLILSLILYYAKNILPLKTLLIMSWKYAFVSFVMIALIYSININSSYWLTVGSKIIIGAIIYILGLLFLRDELVMEVIHNVKR